MKPVSKSTLLQVFHELACHPCDERELDELVAPSMGVISGFQDLLNELEQIRLIALDEIPPAGLVQLPMESSHG